MSLVIIRLALEKRLNAMSPSLDTAWENTSFKPTPGQAYQRVTLVPAAPENPTFGDTLRREIGYLQVMLRYPQNKGSKDAQARAEMIKAWFPRGLALTESGSKIVIDRTPTISPSITDGDRYCIPIWIRYYAEFFS